MSLEADIQMVRDGLKAGRYGSEAAVSQGIVLRLLNTLGWPTYDTQIVTPEFTLSGRRVDYALCYPAEKPRAFIEVKHVGHAEGTERQLFEYAFHIGVQLAILTDGQEWNFFLPGEQGDYTERRVYKLDLIERELKESVNRLERYLGYSATCSGDAIAAARDDYRNVARDRQMAATLPQAWAKLVSEEDDRLLEIIADKVESLCGFKPDPDTVAQFIHGGAQISGQLTNQLPTINRKGAISRASPLLVKRPVSSNGRNSFSAERLEEIGYCLHGTFVPCRNGKDVMIRIFNALEERDGGFLARFASRPKHGRTRRYIARTPQELYPERPDLAQEHFAELKSGWYIGTNVSHAQIEKIVEMACEVSSLVFGKDVQIKIR